MMAPTLLAVLAFQQLSAKRWTGPARHVPRRTDISVGRIDHADEVDINNGAKPYNII